MGQGFWIRQDYSEAYQTPADSPLVTLARSRNSIKYVCLHTGFSKIPGVLLRAENTDVKYNEKICVICVIGGLKTLCSIEC